MIINKLIHNTITDPTTSNINSNNKAKQTYNYQTIILVVIIVGGLIIITICIGVFVLKYKKMNDNISRMNNNNKYVSFSDYQPQLEGSAETNINNEQHHDHALIIDTGLHPN